jgi:protein-S-isoprenylcysteine O-methyltransferase Ste14
MYLPSPNLIGAVFGISELAISLTLRARGDAQRKDRSSLTLIWIVVVASIGIGIWVANAVPDARLPWPRETYLVGLAVFVFGLLLRWWSIWTLGRFFTVQVAIASDHKLIEAGPYRILRHPSYTGSLLMFIGFALCFGNWATLIAMLVPVLAVFGWRIHVEEIALAEAFGDAWRDYVRRTWRLIPLVY